MTETNQTQTPAMETTAALRLDQYLCEQFLIPIQDLISSIIWRKDDDTWKRQNKHRHNALYKLVNLPNVSDKDVPDSNGKDLSMKYLRIVNDPSVYDKFFELQTMLKTELLGFLYEGGSGEPRLVEEEDYIEYRTKITKDVDVYKEDPINQFKPHQACWDIKKRGADGETILHLCYLNNTDNHKAIAKALLQVYPALVYDIYEGDYYFGESALHIAITNGGDLDSVKLLVESGAELDRRATGKFFRPRNTSTYEGQTYYGEYPLAFAASTGNMEIYDYLIEKGNHPGTVDPNAQDSYGNTVAHMTIIHNQKTMFHHVIKHAEKPASYIIKNNEGLTPFQLSYKLGRTELFTYLLELSCQTQWVYGDVAHVAYPLSTLDSIEPNGKPNPISALRTIVQHDSLEHLKMLEVQVIKDLLDKKWQHCSRTTFIYTFFWTILHLLMMSVAVYLRPEDDLLNVSNARNQLRVVAEVGLIISSATKVYFEQREVRSREALTVYFESLRDLPFKCLFMLSIILLFLCIPCRFLHLRGAEDILFIMSLPMAWSYLLFFFKGFKRLGTLIVMIVKMLSEDVLTFFIIYVIFLFTFSKAFYYLFKDADQHDHNIADEFNTWGDSVTTVHLLSLGESDVGALKHCRIPSIAYIVYIIFLLLVAVLSLNMLIAMMQRSHERSLMQWRRQWAMLVLNMEKSISRGRLASYYQTYSTEIKMSWSEALKKGLLSSSELENFDSGKENCYPIRTLLVTKQLPKTRAKTKRDAKHKWKWCCKVLTGVLKKRRMFSDDIQVMKENFGNAL
ncbi:transient receptor potential cation channel subfamily V member 5-like [Amphiura filiformis]|uniref:transient receptor potential cation channel subfamily V member 5-like n=1 Tax=Amphiura filiformis TaxID=82378 RepID=UPI003B228435